MAKSPATKKSGKKAKSEKNVALPRKSKQVDSAQELINKLLSETKERWLKDSSLSILCCTESRTGM